MRSTVSTVLLSLMCLPALAHTGASCKSTPAIVAGKRIVESAPEVLDTRLNLGELLIDAGCYQDAFELLQTGARLHPRDDTLQTRLRVVRSLLDESRSVHSVDEQRARDQAQRSRDALRCTRFGDLEACERSLLDSPGDPALVAAAAAARARRTDAQSISPVEVTVAALPPQPESRARPEKVVQRERYSNIEPRTRSN
jgi:hypothetical protein